ncbi:LysM peptidoglycan-binding domain-containing protein [Halalkalibacter nanhaiisediminis]|uniref:LysM domain-containing protein n=1 Tax=Halalkalibacter nanhaiisediminis TaxID=688079 RepID=A0A562QBG7_9BACI|nr:LysM peptidoglycan-binding domain-containing protein [Halalkalibacter nanhaiisediminis]TWI54059.1 LysM domain-containing protein [Halalkalibacter nanhaiisediminis]
MLAEQGIYFIYTVKPNDTLYGIATKLESTIEEIEQLNGLYPPFTDPGLIFLGQELIVPKRDG